MPGPILISIWGLETNYGADSSGKFSIIRSVATLAYDCRRSEFFTGHLLDAMRIVERGDLTLAQLRGGWAGEIGHTQFLPSGYYKYAVDFDGDGRRDLEASVPDMLASTANFLKGHGWQAGQGWEPGSPNYAVIKEWNKAEVYQRTIAVMSPSSPKAAEALQALDRAVLLSGPCGHSQRATGSAATAPASWAAMKAGTFCGAMPANVSLRLRAMVTAGLANEVEAVNQ